MNLHDIAKEFGIARSTVSSCLSGQEGKYGIRVELAKAVRAYAQRHGYVPNRAAIKLRGRGEDSPLGLVFTYESGMAKVILPIRRIVEYLASIRREYVLMGIENGFIGATMATLRSMDVTEVVVLGALHEPYPKESPDERERRFQKDWRVAWGLLESGMRLYASDYIFPIPPEHAKINMVRVGLNIETMARDVLRKMLDSGLGPVVFSHWLEQEHSFIPELLEDAEMILPMKYSGWPLDEGLALAETILELRKRRKVRSAFIGNDYVAAGVIKGLLDHGIRVPEDIAVIGFGNYDTAPFFTRALTTVSAACGEKGLDLVKSICGDLPPFPVNNELDYHIFERESLQFKPTEKQRKARKILKV
jgi:DNA-binding LacI/PurR family transcriptional regulator